MEFIADGLLIATALTAGLYCLILGRRLRALNDSGSGIGTQIKLLDKALDETRSALTETRESVTALQASARSTLAQLSRETTEATDLAQRIERSVAKAEATLDRLYHVETRIEAHEKRIDNGRIEAAGTNGGPAARPVEASAVQPRQTSYEIEQQMDVAADARSDIERVELPSGTTTTVTDGPEAAPLGGAGRIPTGIPPAGRDATVLRAERMML